MIQFLYKKKDKFNAKLRRRKFKAKVFNKKLFSSSSYNRTISPFPWLLSLRVKHACRLKFKSFIGTEKSLMVTKNKVWIHYDKYPNFFVTKKSSKSRMGKGKGKIVGRILKIHKGETIFNLHLANIFKTKRWLKAIKGTLPTKTSLVPSSWGARRFYFNFYRNKAARFKKFRRKKKKRPFWMKVVVKRSYKIFHLKDQRKKRFWFRRLCRYYMGGLPKKLKKIQFSKFVVRFTDRVTSRRYHFNSFAVNHSTNRRYIRRKRRKCTTKPGVYKRIRTMTAARRRSYFKREETMFYVLESLNLNVRGPDADGYTGMARFLNYMRGVTGQTSLKPQFWGRSS